MAVYGASVYAKLRNRQLFSASESSQLHWTRSEECEVKVKCTLVQAVRLCTDRTAHRGSRGIALPFHDHSTRREWGVRVTPRPLFPPGKDPVPIVQEAVWSSGPVWTGAENHASTGVRSPDRPARSQSLYRLRYPAHSEECTIRETLKSERNCKLLIELKWAKLAVDTLLE